VADPRDEMDELLNACLPFARQMLEQHGEFHPFGATITSEGQLGLEGADPGEEFPAGQDLVQFLVSALKTRAAQNAIKATAICANVTMKRPAGDRDAVPVAIEHRDAQPIVVFMPYRKKRLRGYDFDELSAAEGVSTIFGA